MAATKQVASILIILFLLPLSKSLGTLHHPVQWHGSGTQLLVTDIKFDNGHAISSRSVSHSIIIDHERVGAGGSTAGGNGGTSQGDDPGTKSGAGAANMHQHHHGDTSRLQHSATTTFILILSVLSSLLPLV